MTIRMILLGVCLAAISAQPAWAGSLWTESDEVSGRLASYSVAATRAWAIEPDAGLLANRPETLDLPIPGRALRTAHKERSIYRGPGDLTWIGRMESDDSQVILTVKHGWVAGLVYAEDGTYEITPEAEHGTLIMELDPGAYPACDGGLEPDADAQAPSTGTHRHRATGEPLPAVRGGDAPTEVMDLLVVYTPAVRQFLGGTDQAQAFSQSAVDTGTTSFGNSDVNAEFVMVHAAEMPAQESGACGGSGGDLPTFRDDPAIHKLRDEHHADMVGLIAQVSYCGCGYVMRNPGPDFESSAYQVTARQCAVGNLTYAHEHGHNMGMEHDPANGTSPGNASYPWSFGHFESFEFRTVMSYAQPCTNNNCPRQPHFSNPDILIDGMPTGIADERDNARTATLTAPIISQFRDPPVDLAIVEGEVSGLGYCDADPDILAGATVEIISQSETYTAETDSGGKFELEVPAADGPIDVQASAEGHVSTTNEDIELEAGETVTTDLELRLDAPCASATPVELNLMAVDSISDREDLELVNEGAAALDFQLSVSGPSGCEAGNPVDWIESDPAEGTVAPDDFGPFHATISATDMEPGQYRAYLCMETGDENNELMAIPVNLNLLGPELFEDRFEEP